MLSLIKTEYPKWMLKCIGELVLDVTIGYLYLTGIYAIVHVAMNINAIIN